MTKHIVGIFKKWHILETIVASINTGIIVILITGAIFFPTQTAYLILIFNIYWTYKLVRWALFSFLIERKISKNRNINWYQKILDEKLNINNIYHLVLITSYKESEELLSKTIENIKNQEFPSSRIILVLAMEERDKTAHDISTKLVNKFEKHFFKVWTTFHILEKDETVGKHSNERYSAKKCVEFLRAMKIDIKNVIATITDADVIFYKNYLSNITYNFFKDPDNQYNFYHGANLYYSNFTQIPFIERVFATQLSLWYLASLENKYLGPISTYSLSLNTIKEAGYWDPDVIMEDANIFYKAIYKYKTKIKSVPIYTPLYMTMPQTNKYIGSLKSFYVQLRRYTFFNTFLNTHLIKVIITDKKINPIKKYLLLFDKLEVDMLWPVYWFILTFGLNMFIILNHEFMLTSLGLTFSFILKLTIYVYAFLFINIISVDYQLRRKTSFGKFPIWREIFNLLQWISMPLVGFYTAFLPYIDSQFRLLLNKPLEYVVAGKGKSA